MKRAFRDYLSQEALQNNGFWNRHVLCLWVYGLGSHRPTQIEAFSSIRGNISFPREEYTNAGTKGRHILGLLGRNQDAAPVPPPARSKACPSRTRADRPAAKTLGVLRIRQHSFIWALNVSGFVVFFVGISEIETLV